LSGGFFLKKKFIGGAFVIKYELDFSFLFY